MRKSLRYLPVFYFIFQNFLCAGQPLKDKQDTDYDFKPQEKIIFEDNFSADAEKAFPGSWCITSPCDQQSYTTTSPYCYVQRSGDTASLVVKPVPEKTLENYIQPNILIPRYLPDSFSLEYDFFLETNDASCDLYFNYVDGKCIIQAFFIYNRNNADLTLATNGITNIGTDETRGRNYAYQAIIHKGRDIGVWHHFSLSYNKRNVMCYVDDRMIMHIPDCGYVPSRLTLSSSNGTGIARYANVRLATGNFLTRKAEENFNTLLTEKKLVTHAILFDVDSAAIQQGSLLFLRQFAAFLKEHPQLRLEIDGHTDNDGDAAHNIALSQKRAVSVKKQLTQLGINSARLTVKGYGAGKPLSLSNTPESKAANRRVEFIIK